MIGNDIIDLDYARRESNWQRPGFLKKLFTPQEREKILASTDPQTTVWLLWSMKESTYKIVARQESRSFFAPKKFHTTLPESFRKDALILGSVAYQGLTFQTSSLLCPSHIHTFAWSGENRIAHHYTLPLKRSDFLHQRQYTYRSLIEQFAAFHHLEKQQLTIQKNESGIPRLFYKNKGLPQIISISHHGRFGGFVF